MTSSEALTAPLTLRLFGPMQISVHGQLLPRLRSQKAFWLIALLALRADAPVQREWAAGLLWPDSEQSQAFANLRVVLSDLRKALGSEGGRLQANTRTLFLDLTGAEVDVYTFDRGIKSKNLIVLDQAVALVRGPLLEGCGEEWLPQERRVREQNCLQALQTLAEAALAAQDYTMAAAYYQRAVRMDPWFELAQRGWMEALAKNGDWNAAQQVYREFLNVLRSDPTAVPDPQTSALYARLRAESRRSVEPLAVVSPKETAVPSVSGYLPRPLTELIGREDEGIEVALALRRSHLVTLTGPGGIGKTRLANHVAMEIVGEYADGVWLVALEALAEGRLIVSHLAAVLGVREEAGHPLLQSVTQHLRSRRALLVLDNCEHLLESSTALIGHLLAECGAVRILATSREALRITGEVVWVVPALAFPDTKHLPEARATLLRVLMSYESVQLFVERAQAVQKGFALNGANALTVGQICAQLEGIPLPIELAASRVKAMTVEQILKRLEDHLGLLTNGSRTARLRQQTLRATLDWSYVLLSEGEQALLSRLSVFAGGWTLEAAEQVCGDSGKREERGEISRMLLPSSEVLDLLRSLVDKSLVVFEVRTGETEGRYRLLEMVRQYALERLKASGEADAMKSRHCGFFVSLAEEAAPQLKVSAQGEWLARLEREHNNLRASLAWSERDASGAEATECAAAGLRLASALWRFWYVHGDTSEGRQYLERALARKEVQTRTEVRARALNGAGALAFHQCDYASARALYNEALSIYRELENRQGIAMALNNLSNVASSQGDYTTARALYEESLALKREMGDRYGAAITLSNLGSVVRHLGDYASAGALYEESLRIRRELGDKHGIAMSLNNLGNLAQLQRNDVSARALEEESLSLCRELGDRQGIARALSGLGNVNCRQHDYVSARAHFEEALKLSEELGDKQGIAMSLGNLGMLSRRLGDYVTAQALHEESLGRFQELNDREEMAESLQGLADVMLAKAETQKAVCLWAAAQLLRKSVGVPLSLNESEPYEREAAKARLILGEETFAAAWEQGLILGGEQIHESGLFQDKVKQVLNPERDG